jgi:hypothetical protein
MLVFSPIIKEDVNEVVGVENVQPLREVESIFASTFRFKKAFSLCLRVLVPSC